MQNSGRMFKHMYGNGIECEILQNFSYVMYVTGKKNALDLRHYELKWKFQFYECYNNQHKFGHQYYNGFQLAVYCAASHVCPL